MSVFLFIKAGKNPTQICSELHISKQRLNYYLSSLKYDGFIKKIGYGTWEILKDFDAKQVKKSTHIGQINPKQIFTSKYSIYPPNRVKTDSVRGHAFQFTIFLNNLQNWEKREQILKRLNIDYKPLNIYGGGQSLLFEGRKVWLTSKSIIIFEKSSYFAETAKEAKQYALYDLSVLFRKIERRLKANFGKLHFKVSRQHYALVKNALAKQYDREGNKLTITNKDGLWFIIDNSYNLHEAETIHPKTADEDNKKVQDFFNGLKEIENYTPQFVMNVMMGIQKNQLVFDRNMKSHLEVLNKIGTAIEELRKTLNKSK